MLMLDIPYSVEELCQITLELIKKCGYQEDLYIRPLAYKSDELVANLKLQEIPLKGKSIVCRLHNLKNVPNVCGTYCRVLCCTVPCTTAL